jgi:hypothetical protein
LRPLLVGDHVYKDLDADTLSQILVRYWQAIEELWPEAIDPDSRGDNSLMKSVGVLTMHGIAASVFEAARTSDAAGKVTLESVKRVLAPAARALGDTFWDSRSGEAGKVGTNNKAVRLLSDRILQHLRGGHLSTAIL